MAWTCLQIEERLSDQLDRLLDAAEEREFSAHVGSCPRCTALVVQVSGLVGELHRLEPEELPPRLVYNILDQTLGPRAEKKGWRAWLRWLWPVPQPRFALGAVTVLVTFSILFQTLGIHPTKLTLSDLNPVNVYRAADRHAHLLYARGVKFVNDLRVVYEIQSRLGPDTPPQAAPEPGETPAQKQPREKPPRELNRSDDVKAKPSLLASAVCRWPERSLQ